jgi:hypothetical protein
MGDPWSSLSAQVTLQSQCLECACCVLVNFLSIAKDVRRKYEGSTKDVRRKPRTQGQGTQGQGEQAQGIQGFITCIILFHIKCHVPSVRCRGVPGSAGASVGKAKGLVFRRHDKVLLGALRLCLLRACDIFINYLGCTNEVRMKCE